MSTAAGRPLVRRALLALAATAVVAATSVFPTATSSAAEDFGDARLFFDVDHPANPVYGDEVFISGDVTDVSASCLSVHDCDLPTGVVDIFLHETGGPDLTAPLEELLHNLESTFSTTLTLPPGSYAIYVEYNNPDWSHELPTVGSFHFDVVKRPCATSITQSSTGSAPNAPVTFTATVSTAPTSPTGTVSFFEDVPGDDLLLAIVPVNPATAQAQSPDVGTLLPQGSTGVYAVYSGDDNHLGDCSSMLATHLVSDDLPPVAGDDSASTPMDTPVNIDVLANDTDDHSTPAEPEIVDTPSNGDVEVEADGTVTYTPEDGFFGDDSFTYLSRDDADQQSNLATVSVAVECTPVALPDSYDTTAGVAVAVTDPLQGLLANDDTCDQSVQVQTPPAHGTVTGFDGSNGLLTYTPADGFSGTDQLTYAYMAGDTVVASAIATFNVAAAPDDSSTDTTMATTTTTTPTTTTPTTITPTSSSGPSSDEPGDPSGGTGVSGETQAPDADSGASGSLPTTGYAGPGLALSGLVALAGGTALLAAARRRATGRD